MKRLGLLSIIGCSVSGVAIAAGVDCNVIPSCAEMGFDKTVAECGESKVLRCPFDLTNDDAVFCCNGCSVNDGCGENFNLDVCPEGGICSNCGEKYELVTCDTGYTRNDDTCCLGTSYNFETCPTNGQCTLCGTKYKLDACDAGFTMAESECCSDTMYNLDACPTGGVCDQCGEKYSFTGCQSGYTQSDTTCCSNTTYNLSSCPTNASCSKCGTKYSKTGCKTGYTGADCSSCASGYKLEGGSCVRCYWSCAEAGYMDPPPPLDTDGDGFVDVRVPTGCGLRPVTYCGIGGLACMYCDW